MNRVWGTFSRFKENTLGYGVHPTSGAYVHLTLNFFFFKSSLEICKA
jgi:hypothetical protein